MVRRVTPAEYQRLVREAQRKQQRAIDAYNRQVEQRNREIQRQVQDHNRKVKAHNQEVERQMRRAVDSYNREVRAHNARVRANEQRRRIELQRLSSLSSARHEVFHQAVRSLDASFVRLEQSVSQQDSDVNDDLVLGLPSQENINSIAVMNALLEDGPLTDVVPEELQASKLNAELSAISTDLDARWRGALFALHPRNPDAARHFCTSAREIIVKILDLSAPDEDVIRINPECERTQDGRVTRRAKVQSILKLRGITSRELGDFVHEDIENVLGLFQVFNSATHGEAGKYDMGKLVAIKERVEGGIRFLARLAKQ